MKQTHKIAFTIEDVKAALTEYLCNTGAQSFPDEAKIYVREILVPYDADDPVIEIQWGD